MQPTSTRSRSSERGTPRSPAMSVLPHFSGPDQQQNNPMSDESTGNESAFPVQSVVPRRRGRTPPHESSSSSSLVTRGRSAQWPPSAVTIPVSPASSISDYSNANDLQVSTLRTGTGGGVDACVPFPPFPISGTGIGGHRG